jgi:hypothetical protein
MEEKSESQRLILEVCPFQGFVLLTWQLSGPDKFLAGCSTLEDVYYFLTGYLAEESKLVHGE